VKNVGILVSGRGSNMIALLESMRSGEAAGRPALVLSNESEAPALERARSYGIPTRVVPHREYRGQGREAYDRAVAAALDEAGIDVVCLAGFMRVLSAWFTDRYAGRLINIHPGLLPSFPGLHAQRQALDHGVRIAGCTVHFVDAAVDHGPIIAQAAVPVLADDTEESLSARILEQEHRLYPYALALLCAGRLAIDGRRVHIRTERAGLPVALAVPAP
jgi:phosphoribosylglycinamide formyltransferase-1